MTSEITTYNEQIFEDIKHINDDGQEYWLARELQTVLDYTQWRRFSDTIERAKLACKNSGFAMMTILPTLAKWLTSALARSARWMMLCFPGMHVI